MVSSALADRSYRPSPEGFSLESAASRLYAAFAPIPSARRVPHCEHCVSDADIAALQARPSTLPPDLVSRFVRKTGTTWGGTTELRRVTPRILTLAADHRLNVSRSLVWQQLRLAGGWPEAEVRPSGGSCWPGSPRLLASLRACARHTGACAGVDRHRRPLGFLGLARLHGSAPGRASGHGRRPPRGLDVSFASRPSRHHGRRVPPGPRWPAR